MSEPFWGKKYILRQVWRKLIFFTCDGFFHTLSLIEGCEEKEIKCVENGHSKIEITRKIKKMPLKPQLVE